MPPRKADTVPQNLVTAEAVTAGEGGPGPAPEAPQIGAVLKAGAPPQDMPAGLPPNAPVRARITKTGHGRVHDGHGGAYNWQDEVILPYSVARAQERNSNVEIIGR